MDGGKRGIGGSGNAPCYLNCFPVASAFGKPNRIVAGTEETIAQVIRAQTPIRIID